MIFLSKEIGKYSLTFKPLNREPGALVQFQNISSQTKATFMTKAIRRTALALMATLIIGCDQGTKLIAANLLADKPIQSFFADIFRLLYVENTGGFLGLGGNLPPAIRTSIFTLGTGVILVLFVLLLFRFKWSPRQMTGLTLFIAGGVSNWIDRVIRGSVVDFMNLGIGGLRTGIFNVADAAIMMGIALLLLPKIRKDATQKTN